MEHQLALLWLHPYPELANDRTFVAEAVSIHPKALRYASKAMRDDDEVVALAVSQCGLALEFASKRLRKDRRIVEQALAQDGCALQFASDALKRDWTLSQIALRNNPSSQIYAPSEIVEAMGWNKLIGKSSSFMSIINVDCSIGKRRKLQ